MAHQTSGGGASPNVQGGYAPLDSGLHVPLANLAGITGAQMAAAAAIARTQIQSAPLPYSYGVFGTIASPDNAGNPNHMTFNAPTHDDNAMGNTGTTAPTIGNAGFYVLLMSFNWNGNGGSSSIQMIGFTPYPYSSANAANFHPGKQCMTWDAITAGETVGADFYLIGATSPTNLLGWYCLVRIA